MLGRREPSIYGSTTLDEINKSLENLANQNNIRVDCFQSNHEGEIIDKIHSVSGERDLKGIIINAGGTHIPVLRSGTPY